MFCQWASHMTRRREIWTKSFSVFHQKTRSSGIGYNIEELIFSDFFVPIQKVLFTKVVVKVVQVHTRKLGAIGVGDLLFCVCLFLAVRIFAETFDLKRIVLTT